MITAVAAALAQDVWIGVVANVSSVDSPMGLYCESALRITIIQQVDVCSSRRNDLKDKVYNGPNQQNYYVGQGDFNLFVVATYPGDTFSAKCVARVIGVEMVVTEVVCVLVGR